MDAFAKNQSLSITVAHNRAEQKTQNKITFTFSRSWDTSPKFVDKEFVFLIFLSYKNGENAFFCYQLFYLYKELTLQKNMLEILEINGETLGVRILMNSPQYRTTTLSEYTLSNWASFVWHLCDMPHCADCHTFSQFLKLKKKKFPISLCCPVSTPWPPQHPHADWFSINLH